MKMTELKTLKDFEILEKVRECYKENIIQELKAEAVKWIKDCPCCKIFRGVIQDNDEDRKEFTERDWCFACLRFKHFFNLTEEDLK